VLTVRCTSIRAPVGSPTTTAFADETGTGGNRNVTVPPGSADERWVEEVAGLVAWAEEDGAQALVVALGVDAARSDPESPLRVTGAGFRAAGRALGALGLPTAVVQEGGYDLTTIGGLVHEALAGIEEGARG
jgi:acetoin utilization deacetylase AcuC-like enzyme